MSYLGPSLRRSTRRAPSRAGRLALALAVSLVLNGLLLSQVKVGWMSKLAAAQPRSVTLAPLSASQWAANRALGGEGRKLPDAPGAVAPPAAAPPPPTPPRQMPGQVVDVAPSKNDAPPRDTRFVSERNNTVEKETRSRSARAGYEQTLARPSEPKKSSPPQQAAATSGGGEGGKEGAAKESERRAAGPRSSERPAQKLALQLDPRDGLRPPEAAQQTRGSAGTAPLDAPGKPGVEADGGRRPGRPGLVGPLALRPSVADYDRLSGGPAPDHLEGIDEGEGTYLNTREWKYAGYFNRIKQAVAAQWNPGAAMVARDPGGSKLGYKDWQTLLSVKLDQSGALKDVAVTKSSGLDFLDRTAVDAFQKAQPFVNPPQGLADARGEIAFTFGFYLETGGSGLHLFRSPALPR